jgi:hypothetical protein
MSARWPYEKFRHTLHVLRLATLGDAHPFSIAQLIHARHLLVQLGGLVLYVEGASPDEIRTMGLP